MYDSLSTFWVLWGLTLAVCLWQGIRTYSNPAEFLGLPLVGTLLFAYFYVFQAFFVATQLNYLLQPWMFEFGQTLALLCLCAMLVGWYTGRRRFTIRGEKYPPMHLSTQVLWWVGVGFMAIGILGLYTFRASEVGFGEASAYWYMSFHLAYPGVVICLQAMARDRQRRNLFNFIVVAVSVMILMYPFVLAGRRGPLFPIVIVLLYGYTFAAGKRPNRALISAALVATGTAMLVFVLVRDYSGAQATLNLERLSGMSYQDVVTDKAQTEGDNEYLYHCGMAAAAYDLGMYQYGTGYLSLPLNWIPRHFWEDKPRLGQGWYEPVLPHVGLVTGWQLTTGAAAGGVAETFQELGFAAPLFWFLFGLVAAKMFSVARDTGDLRNQASFIGLLASQHWLIAQGFAAAFIPMLIYQFVPLIAFHLAKVNAAPRKMIPAEVRGAQTSTLTGDRGGAEARLRRFGRV